MASAQNISVSSFKWLENDLTANTHGTMVKDFNGEVAALIKVVTPEKGFAFDGGMVGIVKTKPMIGEVWVYVPHGIKKISIMHENLGLLRDYYFPIPIEKACTYEMVLVTGKSEVVVTETVNKQYVVFSVQPVDAMVELNGELLTVDEEGHATKGLPFGVYDYRVSHANYHTEAGKVTVTAEEKSVVNVALRPNCGWVKLTGDAEYHKAQVYIDNTRVGQLPFTSKELNSGMHKIRVVKSMYKSYEREVSVSDGETVELDVQLVPNFATVTLMAESGSEIWIDGERRGTGQWTGPLEIGEYKVEVKKESHRTSSEVVRVDDASARTIRLKAPLPITATLEIASVPSFAAVYIDGTRVGETPLIKSNLLVGNHRITFKKEGYKTVDKVITVKEGTENSIEEKLYKVQSVAPAPQPANTISSPSASKDADGTKWLAGIDMGYSTYGFNYGGEVGLMIDKLSLSAGVKSHVMGSYEYINRTAPDWIKRKVRLLRFSTQLGYTFGEQWQFTPLVGVLFGPSCLTGRDYIFGKILSYDTELNEEFSLDDYLLRTEYSDMNVNIMRFARHRCSLVLGARLGYALGSKCGIHITPEYVVGEGVSVNAGVMMKF